MPVQYPIGSVKVTDTGSDITLSVYLKDDASFNGKVWVQALHAHTVVSDFPNEITPTTSYAQQQIVVDSADLINNEYLEMWVLVQATAGNVYVDDFSASQ